MLLFELQMPGCLRLCGEGPDHCQATLCGGVSDFEGGR